MTRVALITTFVISSILCVQAQTQQQAPASDAAAKQQAAIKLEIDRAELAYRGEKYSDAQDHAEKALLLDSTNKKALMLVARSMRALFRNDDPSPENQVRAREAIAAYQRVLTLEDDDEAYTVVTELYGAINEDELQYAWIMQRAISFDLPVAKRVEAYIDLARCDIRSSSDTSQDISNRLYSETTGNIEIEDLDNVTRSKITRALEVAARGRQMVRQAIALDPYNDNALACEVQLLQISARLFELEGNDKKGEELRAESDDVSDQAVDARQKREEAAKERMVAINCGELCDKVISTPKPPYPPIARTARAYGAVTVQIVIDEGGNVIAATATSGHPLLRAASVQAARLSTFSRTMSEGQPVRVIGALTYIFSLP